MSHTRQGAKFHKQAEKALGNKITIISGRKEAHLTAHGVISSLPNAAGICGDLGGGSMELADICRGRVLHTSTLQLGTLTLLGESHRNVDRANPIIKERLQNVRWLGSASGQTFYAIGGIWRAVGRVMMATKISHRADVIPVAAAILAQLIDHIKPICITFSGCGVREGVVRKM